MTEDDLDALRKAYNELKNAEDFCLEAGQKDLCWDIYVVAHAVATRTGARLPMPKRMSVDYPPTAVASAPVTPPKG